ncbi:hypothetical protein [Sphingomonas lenta]|nr:hypothetical protein [Sphingomonas lenta]
MYGPEGEMVAYALLGLIALGGSVAAVVGARRRHRRKLRRRGIKRHGH